MSISRIVCVGALLLGAGQIAAQSAANYRAIVERNAFGLKPAQPGSAQISAGEPFKPPPDYKLTGIVAYRTNRWAMLLRQDPGKPPRYYTLRPGEREESLELLEVDAKAGTVRIRNEGVFVLLSFKTHGVAP